MKRRNPSVMNRLLLQARKYNRSLCILALAIGSPCGIAGATTPYSPDRVLKQQDNACLAGAGCETVPSGTQVLQPGEAKLASYSCPDSEPYILGWDATHHESVSATVSAKASTQNTLALIIANNSDYQGKIRVYLGCSTQASPAGSLIIQSISGVPTNPEAATANPTEPPRNEH